MSNEYPSEEELLELGLSAIDKIVSSDPRGVNGRLTLEERGALRFIKAFAQNQDKRERHLFSEIRTLKAKNNSEYIYYIRQDRYKQGVVADEYAGPYFTFEEAADLKSRWAIDAVNCGRAEKYSITKKLRNS